MLRTSSGAPAVEGRPLLSHCWACCGVYCRVIAWSRQPPLSRCMLVIAQHSHSCDNLKYPDTQKFKDPWSRSMQGWKGLCALSLSMWSLVECQVSAEQERQGTNERSPHCSPNLRGHQCDLQASQLLQRNSGVRLRWWKGRGNYCGLHLKCSPKC